MRRQGSDPLRIVIVFILFCLWATVSAVRAQDGGVTPTPRPVSDNEVNRVSKNLYCPVCENVPLEVCPTETCRQWREEVRDLLSRGYTEEEVRQHFAARYGAKAVGTPIDAGTQFVAVTLPYLLIGVAGIGLAVLLLRWRRYRAITEAEAVAQVDDQPADQDSYRAQLEEELRKRY